MRFFVSLNFLETVFQPSVFFPVWNINQVRLIAVDFLFKRISSISLAGVPYEPFKPKQEVENTETDI